MLRSFQRPVAALALALTASQVLPAAAQTTPAPDAEIIQGFHATVYHVSTPSLDVAPVPTLDLARTCGAAFANAALPPDPAAPPTSPTPSSPAKDKGYWLNVGSESNGHTCTAVMMTPVMSGLQFDFAIVRPTPPQGAPAPPGPNRRPQYAGTGASASKVDFKGQTHVALHVCPHRAAPCPDEEIVVLLDRNDNVLVSRGDSIAAWIQAKSSAIGPAPPCTWKEHHIADPRCLRNHKNAGYYNWAESVIIPWSAFGLEPNPARYDVSGRLDYHGPLDGTATSFTTQGDVQIAVEPAFVGVSAQPSLPAGADHRYFAMTGYDRYFSPTSTPPPTQQVVMQGSTSGEPTTVSLYKPAKAQPVPDRFPPVTADLSAPITQAVALAGTISQNNGTVKAVQNAIKTSAGAEAFPSPNPLPSVTCKSCATFQSLNASNFDTLTGSAAGLDLPNTSVGSEDVPFKLSTLGDLFAGGALSVSTGGTTWSALRTQLNNSASQAYTNTALAMTQQHGAASWSLVAASAAQPPAPAHSSPPSPPTTVTIPYLTSYSIAARDDRASSDDQKQSVNDFTTFGRFAYDQTDHAMNFFGAVQDQFSVLGTKDNRFVSTVALGYRGVGQNYNELDGTQTSLPSVSGPLGVVDIASGPFDVRLDGNSYYSSTDQASSRELKTSWQAAKQLGIYYKVSSFRQTAPLLAVNTLSAQLGDAPFQGAVNEIQPDQRFATFGGHDQEAGVNYTINVSKYRPTPSIATSAGFDFDNVTPSCKQNFVRLPGPSGPGATTHFRPLIACADQPRRESLSLSASVISEKFVLGGSYAPTLQAGQSGSPGSYTYNAVMAYAPTQCDSLIVTASNKQSVLPSGAFGQTASGFQAELDHEGRFQFIPKIQVRPTVFVGYSNTFGYQQAAYVTQASPVQLLQLQYPTRNSEFYVGLRYGNPSFLKTLSERCAE